jgi:hypothetical protein
MTAEQRQLYGDTFNAKLSDEEGQAPKSGAAAELLHRRADGATVPLHQDGVHFAIGRVRDVAEGIGAVGLLTPFDLATRFRKSCESYR